jgi:UDP-N-acetylmuramoyl-L-alanyl-D-glutamate--2,6-diaminopimelate ligase
VAASRTLAEVAARLGIPAPAGSADVAVSGTTLDSRAVRPGDLYAALPGARTHGARFTAQAAAAGAVAVLTDDAGSGDAAAAGLPTLAVPDPRAVLGDLAAWLYGHPAEALTVIGITGTNGKTTTAYLAEAGLRAAGRTTGLIGTVETRIGDDALPSARTTPEAPDLQALFAVMRERGVDAAVMEVSSHALAQGRVDGTVYDVAVFTNLSQDHLDFHGDIEDYFAAKAQLFTAARARRAVVDVDDAYGARLAAEAGIPVTTVSPSGASADWRCEDVVVEPAGSRFLLRGPDGEVVDGAVRLPGDFNVANAALAVVALACAGVDAATAATGVAARAGVPGRMERVDAGQPFLAVVDYAHTPDAVAVAVAAVRPGLTGGSSSCWAAAATATAPSAR